MTFFFPPGENPSILKRRDHEASRREITREKLYQRGGVIVQFLHFSFPFSSRHFPYIQTRAFYVEKSPPPLHTSLIYCEPLKSPLAIKYHPYSTIDGRYIRLNNSPPPRLSSTSYKHQFSGLSLSLSLSLSRNRDSHFRHSAAYIPRSLFTRPLSRELPSPP